MAPKRKATVEQAERASRGRVRSRLDQSYVHVPQVREIRPRTRNQPSTSSGAPRMSVRRNNVVQQEGAENRTEEEAGEDKMCRLGRKRTRML